MNNKIKKIKKTNKNLIKEYLSYPVMAINFIKICWKEICKRRF